MGTMTFINGNMPLIKIEINDDGVVTSKPYDGKKWDKVISELTKAGYKRPTIDPYKVYMVFRLPDGKRVGSIHAKSPKASVYEDEMAKQHGKLIIDFEDDPTEGLLFNLR